jgi:PAS domain S-box-containing protein
MPYDRKAYFEEIRTKAEQVANQRDLKIPTQNAIEYQRLLHELNVHQIELEIQNEELLATQVDLEKARNQYADLFNNAPVGYVILDQNGFIKKSNQTLADLFGVDVSSIQGKPLSQLLPESSQRTFLSQFKAFFKNPINKTIDIEVGESIADARTLRLYGRKATSTIDARNGEQACLRIIATDITEQRSVERALKESHKDLRVRHRIAETMLDSDDSAMFEHVLNILLEHFDASFGYFGFIDEEGCLVCPSMTREIYPKCAVENKDIVFPREDWGGIWGESLAHKRTVYKDEDLELPAGHIHLSNAIAVPIVNKEELIGQIVIGNKSGGFNNREIAEVEAVSGWIAPVLSARIERDQQRRQRIKAENELRQAQRLESIGVLAGGIAHDFNNLLAPIIGYTDLMMMDMTSDERQRYHVHTLARAANRAKDLVGQLLAFSRKQMLEVKPLNINTVVEELSNMLKRLIREDIEIIYHLSDESLLIRGDAGQLDQVLLNLATNAQDAMTEGGKIMIETDRFNVADSFERYGFTISPGKYCRIRFHDTGEGIQEKVRPHIFEPFFTTKERGKGTGMGLATCYGIVKQHDGYIWVDPDDGSGGSIFTILIPLTSLSQRDASTQNTAPPIVQDSHLDSRIMVVEDESAVRTMAVLALKKRGFTVFDADSPSHCLERVKTDGISFDLLLSDIIMPGCSGKDLFRQLKKEMPDLKVLYMSGYSDNVISEKGLLKEGVNFIGKPFSIDELTIKILGILGGQE